MKQLFIYGTLQFPAVLRKITGKTFHSVTAVLPGFKRLRVKNCDYPAVIANSNSTVNGMLLLDVDEKSMEQISAFEGEEYKLMQATVLAEQKKVHAHVFVWHEAVGLLEEGDWDEKEFELKFLKNYT